MVENIAQGIRRLALTNRPREMFGLEFCLIESFATYRDFDEVSLWSLDWRTFALLVAEAIENDGSHSLPS